MGTIYIVFSYAEYRLNFDDDILSNQFATVFQTIDTATGRFQSIVDIKGNENTGYSVFLNENFRGEMSSRAEAVYCVAMIFDENICVSVDDPVCIVHAASVLHENAIVSFSGVSGSGKTTLSLLFSEYGHFVGDEYAYLDTKAGSVWHERHPYQLKKSNKILLPAIDPALTLATDGIPFGTAYYISLQTTNYRFVGRDDRIPLKAIVFPHFDKNCGETRIAQLSGADFPNAILQSCMGKDSPSVLFGKIVRLASVKQLAFLEIYYQDGFDAANKLNQYFSGELREVK
jgi:hypothetical protein